MSGTSLDGIDVAIVDFNNVDKVKLIDFQTYPYKSGTTEKIKHLTQQSLCKLSDLCQLDVNLAKQISSAINHILDKTNIHTKSITAIGCHGQTIKHDPEANEPYTLQIGDPNTIASFTNITTVADFRRKDIALGGQAAPFAPAFHQYMFNDQHKNRVIINIGGIANVTVLPSIASKRQVIGFDTGPGNVLMDQFCLKHFDREFDKNGALAATGTCNSPLIEALILDEAFFNKPPPKSTGTEYFNEKWLNKTLNKKQFSQLAYKDIMATLCHLTAKTIVDAIEQLSINIDEVYLCGGGAHNATLITELEKLFNHTVHTTNKLGVSPDCVEAIAFAWFAKNTLDNKTSNLPSVTNASRSAVLGGIFHP